MKCFSFSKGPPCEFAASKERARLIQILFQNENKYVFYFKFCFKMKCDKQTRHKSVASPLLVLLLPATAMDDGAICRCNSLTNVGSCHRHLFLSCTSHRPLLMHLLHRQAKLSAQQLMQLRARPSSPMHSPHHS